MAHKPPARARRGDGDGPHPVDIRAGALIRQRRIELGMTQQRLAAEIGVSFQQLQKYERGTNRIGASRLYRLSRALEVRPGDLFAEAGALPAHGFSETSAAFETDPLGRRETVDLVNAYYEIAEASLRRKLLDLAAALAARGGETDRPRRRRGRAPKSRLTGEPQGSTRAPRRRGRPRRTPN